MINMNKICFLIAILIIFIIKIDCKKLKYGGKTFTYDDDDEVGYERDSRDSTREPGKTEYFCYFTSRDEYCPANITKTSSSADKIKTICSNYAAKLRAYFDGEELVLCAKPKDCIFE